MRVAKIIPSPENVKSMLTFQNEGYRNRDLLAYLAARLLAETATIVLSVAVGWDLYRISNSPLALGIVGLAQFIPNLLFALPVGELSDQRGPRGLLALGLATQGVCCTSLALLFSASMPRLWPIYAVMVLFGLGRTVSDPTGHALLPLIVSPQRLPSAISWDSSFWQVAIIAGPALGGFAYALGRNFVYGLCCVAFAAAVLGIATVKARRWAPCAVATLSVRVDRIVEGIRFVRSDPILLGAISLDLFAVLLGGATALLPVFARDVLHVGPIGLGLLRSAPALGALVMGLWQTRHPIGRWVGMKLLASVAGFGIATTIFSLSTSMVVSLVSLACLGASDMVSVNIRSSLVQLATSDAMRGRVSALNSLFISASSELGAFESGIAAALLGAVPAVLVGGLGTLAVAAIWLQLFPALRKVDRMPQGAYTHPRQ
jgi:MFS family permease